MQQFFGCFIAKIYRKRWKRFVKLSSRKRMQDNHLIALKNYFKGLRFFLACLFLELFADFWRRLAFWVFWGMAVFDPKGEDFWREEQGCPYREGLPRFLGGLPKANPFLFP